MSKQSASGLAIAGFVILMLSVFIPIYGLYIGVLALLLVTIGAFFGEKLFTILTVTVSALKVWFLSPTFQVLVHGHNGENEAIFMGGAIVAHAIPLAAMYAAAQRAKNAKTPPSGGTGMPRGN